MENWPLLVMERSRITLHGRLIKNKVSHQPLPLLNDWSNKTCSSTDVYASGGLASTIASSQRESESVWMSTPVEGWPIVSSSLRERARAFLLQILKAFYFLNNWTNQHASETEVRKVHENQGRKFRTFSFPAVTISKPSLN